MYKLTQQDINNANRNGYYLRPSEKGWKKYRLTGAQRLFKTNPSVVYHPNFRIMGTKEEVTRVLLDSGHRLDDINRMFERDEFYTSNNYNGSKKEQFSDELRRTRTKRGNVDLDNLLPSLRNSVRNLSLKQVIDSIPNDKIVDVSNMDEKGRGYRIVKKTKRRLENKVYKEQLPIFSSNVEQYNKAIRYLGQDYVNFVINV
jgi:hypothetical protein